MLGRMVVNRTDRAVEWLRSLRRAERFVPWTVSLVAHGLLLIVGFFVVWTVAPPALEDRAPIVVSFDNPSPAPVSSARPEPIEAGAGSEAARRDVPLPALPTPSLSDLVASKLPSAVRTTDEKPSAREAVHERRLPEVRFAGLGVSNAVDIVYVVDASGSMVTMLPVVIDYLRRSVTRLARTQRFQIIFYGREEYQSAPHPGDVQEGVPTTRLIRATPENVKYVLTWASSIIPGGRSNPVPALKRALWLKPDAVFLLSNVITGVGQWEADKATLLAEVDALNPVDERTGRRRTVIKALQFLEEDPAEILKAIGETHGGEDGYKFIPRGE